MKFLHKRICAEAGFFNGQCKTITIVFCIICSYLWPSNKVHRQSPNVYFNGAVKVKCFLHYTAELLITLGGHLSLGLTKVLFVFSVFSFVLFLFSNPQLKSLGYMEH